VVYEYFSNCKECSNVKCREETTAKNEKKEWNSIDLVVRDRKGKNIIV
jgi:hypothetical protein